MNVLHVCCNYAGSMIYTQLCTHLPAQGVSQQVYVPEKHAQNVGQHLPDGDAFQVHYSLIVRPWDRALYYTKARRAAPDVARKIDLPQVNLMHAHTLFTDGGIAYRLHRAHGIPYVVSVRMTDLSYFFRWMPHLRGHGLRILQAAQRIVFLSPAARDSLFAQYVPQPLQAALRRKSQVIPNGIDPSWLGGTPRAWQPRTPLHIAFAGKLEANKQPLRAVEAALALGRLMPDAPVKLHIAGSGPLAAALRAHPAASSGMLTVHGQLEPDALRALYDACHLFLLPSRNETFGVVYLEAMSRGLPVLYTRGQGFDGQFSEGDAGFATNPDDAQNIAHAALRALDGYAARSARCIALAAPLTWEEIARRHHALYTAALGGGMP